MGIQRREEPEARDGARLAVGAGGRLRFHPGSCAHDHGFASNDDHGCPCHDRCCARYYDTATCDHHGSTRDHHGSVGYDDNSAGRHDRCRFDDGSSGHGDQPAPSSQTDTGALPGGVHAGA